MNFSSINLSTAAHVITRECSYFRKALLNLNESGQPDVPEEKHIFKPIGN
jgi:hypothetical protein